MSLAPPRFAVVFLLGLAAALPAPAQHGSIDVVPEDAVDVERTEAVASTIGTALAKLAAAFALGDDPLVGPEASALIGERSVGVRADAAEWQPVRFRAGAAAPVVASVRPPPDFEAGPAIDPGTGPEDAADDVRAAFEALEAALGGLPTRPLELATKRVEPVQAADADGEFYDTRVRVRAVREGERASLVRAVWIVRWRVAEDALELVAFDQRLVERAEASATAPPAPWMPDVTPSTLLGRALPLARVSLFHLRDQIDRDLGVGVLGHHGVAVADVNGDGIDDLFLPEPGGVANQLWVRSPDGSAVEVARAAGLDHLDATTSALLLDFDGDGDRDIVLALATGLQFFVQGPTGFTKGPFFERGSMTSLAAADVDSDGRIDLYGCAYADPYRGVTFPVPYHDAENGQANILLMNRGQRHGELVFVDETEERGLGVGARRFSFAATFEDIDGDGDPDLYVANDFGRNALYVNDGAGRFVESAAALGVEDIAAGMGATFDDIDGDGLVDLYVTNMESSAGRRVTGRDNFRPDLSGVERALFRRHAKGNTLFLGLPGGGFAEAPEVATQGRWAWGGIATDLEGDGLLDLFVPNGFVSTRRSGKPDL